MSGWLPGLLGALERAPDGAVYLVLSLLAALENPVPPVPADVTILFGGFLAGRGVVSAVVVFLVVWVGNVAGALVVYGLGRRHGTRFFQGRWGRLLLRPEQLESLTRFYGRWGLGVVFVSRFLPMFRAVVPVFAGVAGLRFWPAFAAIASASALWYGALVYLGATAGANWAGLVQLLSDAGRGLWVVAALATLAVVWWWRGGR